MEKKNPVERRKAPTFRLKRETVQYLDSPELATVVGGASGACCYMCSTVKATDCRCPPAP